MTDHAARATELLELAENGPDDDGSPLHGTEELAVSVRALAHALLAQVGER